MLHDETFKIKLLLAIFCLILLFARFYLIVDLPFFDTTEARYSEVARMMVDTQSWLVPLFDYDQPFLGKPPLHTWASAVFIRTFGENEWVVRLPHYLTSIAIVILSLKFSRKIAAENAPWTAVILLSSPVFWVASGMVMTDIILLFGITLSMFSIWHLLESNKDETSYAVINLGLGLAIGLLAKGPVVIALIAISLIMHLSFNSAHRTKFFNSKFFISVAICLGISMPWYIATEYYHPGFLYYFIVGEHLLRFLDSGWDGDRYGQAHDEAYGTIWIYFAGGFAFWTLILIGMIISKIKNKNQFCNYERFLLAWLFSPMILFTLSGNILSAYVLPAAVPLALFISKNISNLILQRLTVIVTIVYLSLYLYLTINNEKILTKSSDKHLIEGIDEDLLIFYQTKLTFSGRYYSKGRAKKIENIDQIERWVLPTSNFYLVTDSSFDTYWRLDCEKVREYSERTLSLCSLRL